VQVRASAARGCAALGGCGACSAHVAIPAAGTVPGWGVRRRPIPPGARSAARGREGGRDARSPGNARSRAAPARSLPSARGPQRPRVSGGAGPLGVGGRAATCPSPPERLRGERFPGGGAQGPCDARGDVGSGMASHRAADVGRPEWPAAATSAAGVGDRSGTGGDMKGRVDGRR
jgi:hypothetical protein